MNKIKQLFTGYADRHEQLSQQKIRENPMKRKDKIRLHIAHACKLYNNFYYDFGVK
jgi:hypothetical protein